METNQIFQDAAANEIIFDIQFVATQKLQVYTLTKIA